MNHIQSKNQRNLQPALHGQVLGLSDFLRSCKSEDAPHLTLFNFGFHIGAYRRARWHRASLGKQVELADLFLQGHFGHEGGDVGGHRTRLGWQ